MCFCFDCVSHPEATLINSINEKTNNIFILLILFLKELNINYLLR